jgi:hypothetical protein
MEIGWLVVLTLNVNTIGPKDRNIIRIAMKILSWLPTVSPPIDLRPENLKYLIVTPPKWGKSTLFGGCPNVLLLAFEAGYEQIKCPKVVITAWDRSFKARKKGPEEDERGIVYASAMEVIEELERSNETPSLIMIDTIDEGVKLCSKYHCDQARVSHPSEGGDWGRGWAVLQTDPFRHFYNRITKLGCGVACITHSKEKQDEDKRGKKRVKRETSLPTGIQEFVYAQSDVIMYGFFGRKRKNQKKRDRFVSFDSSNETMTGTRLTDIYIPDRYIVEPPVRGELDRPWKQWVSFFEENPAAGQQAEKDFVRLIKGLDDESLEEEETEEETEPKEKVENRVKEKVSSPIVSKNHNKVGLKVR